MFEQILNKATSKSRSYLLYLVFHKILRRCLWPLTDRAVLADPERKAGPMSIAAGSDRDALKPAENMATPYEVIF